MSFPSVKRIQERLGVDRDKAKRIRGLMDGSERVENHPSVKPFNWGPNRHRADKVLKAIDAELYGHGVESVEREGAWVDRYWLSSVANYVNVGDTYSPTILYDTERGSYYVTTLGDWVETYERSKRGRIN